ncbi:sensor histidine kinase [Streptomonospora wellingtoniae]|uniref:Sensor histidine kinase n=1 Tax=Streptomonospora wellingtoniae TaxID=3075544 RepID=A0ABU2KYR2_9ACTN|nr:sensor histidine kinase [Streptomonospora sp. DSM 45055]MDT0304346.1 sensor histidine kinase [Streptomonospora sp. DSM 45055]
MAETDTDGGQAALSGPGGRAGRRLDRARLIVLSLSTTTPFFCVFSAVIGASNLMGGGEVTRTFASRGPFPADLALSAVGVLCSVLVAYLSMRVIRTRIDRPSATLRRDVALSYLALLVTVGLLGPNPATLSVPQFWAASVAVTGRIRNKTGYAALMLAAGVTPVLAFAWGLDAPALVTIAVLLAIFHVFVFLVMLFSNVAIIVLWDAVTEAHAARHAQARLAVTEERLRFARDMHDLLGHSLSALAVKSELAARLVEADPQAAGREMTAVQHLARDALREVRTAVSGYRDVNLAAEAEGIRAVLAAAGVRCTVVGADSDLPAEQRSLASWVVREGTTNVLRHSSAKRCAVTLRRDRGALVAEVFDDGTQAGGRDGPPFGNGLSGLAERVASSGGALTAGPASRGEGFLLRAVLPLPAGTRGGGADAAAPPGRPTGLDSGMKDVTA